jgi:putative ABC transport system permease protein
MPPSSLDDLNKEYIQSRKESLSRMIRLTSCIRRGARDAVRNPLRLGIIVVLLATCLTFAAAMVSVNAGAQSQLDAVNKSVGTGIDVRPAFTFGFSVAGTLSKAQIAKAEAVPGVTGATEVVQDRYQGTALKGTVKLPKQFRRFSGGGSGGQGSGGGFPGQGSGSGPGRRPVNTAKGNTIPPTITGITGKSAGIALSGGGTVTVASGRDLTTADRGSKVALMSTALAGANKLHVGSTFMLGGKKVKLVGLYTTGVAFADDSIVVPISLAQAIFKLKGATALTLYAKTSGAVAGLVKRLQSTLGSKTTVEAENSSSSSLAGALSSTSKNMKAALIGAVLAAALIIIFAVFIMVRERTREFGLMKAIGASTLNIVSQFTTEIGIITVGSAAVAVVLLVLFGNDIAHAFNISTAGASTGARFGGFGGRGGFTPPAGGFTGTFQRFGAASSRAAKPFTAALNGQTLGVMAGAAVGLAIVASWVPTWYVTKLRPARVLSNS